MEFHAKQLLLSTYYEEKKKNRRSQINFMVNYFHKVNLSEVMDVVSLVPSGDSRV